MTQPDTPARRHAVRQHCAHPCAVASLALLLLVAAAASTALGAPPADTTAARQELRIILEPETGRIRGHCEIRLHAGQGREFLLHPRMSVRMVRVDGQAADFTFRGGRLVLGSEAPAPTTVSIEYEGVFPEPIPVPQFSSDNPAFGVAMSITPQGVFLQGGSGWHPALPDRPSWVRLEVEAPLGFLAVTAGRVLGHEDKGTRTVSRWEVRPAFRSLPLSAGPYVLNRLDTGPVPVLTYLFPDNTSLAEAYLEASARHLTTYEELHGPYPFDHFAVVENFFPTGYGMPSYTLLGSTVLRLPFIPETSLRHEVAHCWWGNGVLVNPALGNWSEGLTTYVADHLSQEEISPSAAREYRLRALRDYAQLAAGPRDFPLSQFLSRSDPATQAVGYGKAMFVVHMIRQRLGEERFWEGLRAFYKHWLFRGASWQDMFDTFMAQGWERGESRGFLRQWVLREGAPELFLKDVEVRPLGDQWEVDAVLGQNGPGYDLPVTVRMETEGGLQEMVIPLSGPQAPFTIASAHRPLRLTADPDCHIFRLLAASEIPPTVNSVKGSASLEVILADDFGGMPGKSVAGFLSSLDQPGARVLTEREAEKAGLAKDLLFLGYPRSARLRKLLAPPPNYGLTPGGEWFDEGAHPGAGEFDAIFVTMPDARGHDGVTALFHARPGLGEAAVVDAARRITHYGKESYLGFAGGRNRLRGAWPPVHSPLTVEFTP